MSYTDFIAKPISQKNILVEIDLGSDQTSWITYEPGIWQWDWTDFISNTTYDCGNGAFTYGALGGDHAGIFNGTNTRVVLPSEVYSIFNPVNAFSVSVWVKLDTLTPSEPNGRVIEIRQSTGHTARIQHATGSQSWSAVVYDGSGNSAFTQSPASSTTLEWTHLILTWNGSDTINLYVDEDVYTDIEAQGTATPIEGYIGGYATTDNFDGLMDQIRIFDYELSSTEATTLYNIPRTGVDPGDLAPIAYYPFNESDDDYSGNGYDGAQVNLTYEAYSYTTDLGVNEDKTGIGSIVVDAVTYTEATSLATLRANEKYWMYDVDTGLILVHFDDEKWPDEFLSILLGITSGYVSDIPGVYNFTYYEPRVISVPSLVKKTDSMFYGLISYDGGTITLDNTDGGLDDFINQNVFGQEVRVLFGGDALSYSDYEVVYTTKVDDFNINEEIINIRVKDARKSFDITIPENVFKESTYLYLNENDDNKPIPLGYGSINRALATCLNLDERSVSHYTFKLVDTSTYTIASIDAVYVGGAEITPLFINLEDGIFGLNSTDFDPENDTKNEAEVSFTGYKGLDSGLIARYPFDGDSNDTENDYDLTPTGVTFVDGVEGQAAYFDGSAYETMPEEVYTAFNTGKPFSVSLRVKMDSLQTKDVSPRFFEVRNSGNHLARIYYHLTNQRFISNVFDGTGSSAQARGPIGDPDTSSTQLGMTWNGSDTLKIYVNGELGETSVVAQGTTIGDSGWIGGIGASNSTEGSIQDFLVFDYELNEYEMAKLATQTRYDPNKNALSIMRDLLINYGGAAYNSDAFDVEAWELAEGQVSNIGIFIEDSTVIDTIGNICNTVQGNFIVNSEGKYSFKLNDTSATAVKTITKENILSQSSGDYESDEQISSVVVKYNRSWNAKKFTKYIDDSVEVDQFIKYRRKTKRDYEVLLTNETDAEALASYLLGRYKDIVPTFNVQTKTQNIDLELFDTVNVELNRRNKTMFGTVKCEVVGISVDFNNNTTKLKLRFIEDV